MEDKGGQGTVLGGQGTGGQGTVLCLRSRKNLKGTIKNLKGKYKWQHSNIILTWMSTGSRC